MTIFATSATNAVDFDSLNLASLFSGTIMGQNATTIRIAVGGMETLAKPFRRQELVALVRRCLHSAAGS